MTRTVTLVLLPMLAMTTTVAGAQTRKKTAPRKTTAKTTAKAPATTPAKTSTAGQPATAPAAAAAVAQPGTLREAPLMQCPSVLGNGAKSQRLFCDVLVGSHAAGGLRINIPEHQGVATLRFTLHNRQVVADEPGPAFARYTAALKIVKNDGAVLGNAIVQSEYRTPADLIERISGGAGPGGVKTVAPTGAEPIVVDVPADVREVSLLGDQLKIERLGGTELINTPGRPIAVVSQVQVEYRPVTSATAR